MSRKLLSLSELKAGQSGLIVESPVAMMEVGCVPKTQIVVLNHKPYYVKFRGSTVAINEGLAQKIIVEKV